MIHFWFITPQNLHWRARKKISCIENLISQIIQYSGRNIKVYVDTDTMVVIDPVCNRILGSCEVSYNLDHCFFLLGQIRDFFYYHSHFDEVAKNEKLRNRYINLKQRFYGKKEKSC